MKNEVKNASQIMPGTPLFMVVEKPIFPNSEITISDVTTIITENVGWGPGKDDSVRVVNGGDIVVKCSGNPAPGTGDIIFSEQIAMDVWGETMEKSEARAKKAIKKAEESVDKAKEDLKGVQNHKQAMTKAFLSKGDLKFGAEGEIKELKLVKESK